MPKRITNRKTTPLGRLDEIIENTKKAQQAVKV
jgi:hypothetical protein